MWRRRGVLPATLLLLATAAWSAETEPATPVGLGRAVPKRPDPEGIATEVSLAFIVNDVIEISDLRQEFTADIFLRARWRDPRLGLPAQAVDRSERILPVDGVWHPQLGSLNRREVELSLPQVVKVDADGLVTYLQRVYGSFATRMDLRDFPSDTQTLALQVASYSYSPAEVEFRIEPIGGLSDELSVTGWQLELGEPEVAPVVIAGAERTLATATLRMIATREVKYYALTMALPLLFIAVMAWAVFWIDPALLPPQIAISTATVFSLIAFRFSLQLSLPRISYLTRLDWFVLMVTILVFGAFGHVIVVGRLAKTGREELAARVDLWGRWTYPILVLGLAAILLR